jgi:VanZ family protein
MRTARPVRALRDFAFLMSFLHRALAALVHARNAWRWATAMLVIVVCWFAFAPSAEVPTAFWDKANHALAFVVLTFSARFAFPRAFWPSVLGMAGFGFAIEVVQFFLPSRNSEWYDLLADCVGVAIGAGLAALLLKQEDRA